MSKTLGRTFYFEKSLWAKLDEDASRCKRSSTKQLEAILTAYYNVGDVALNSDALEVLGELAPKSKEKTDVIPAPVNVKKKKSA